MLRNLLLVFLSVFLFGCPDPPPENVVLPPPPSGKASKPAAEQPDSKPVLGEPEALQPIGEEVRLQASAVDPVCGKQVDLLNAPATAQFGDTSHVFCSDACARAFKESPKDFLRGKKPAKKQ